MKRLSISALLGLSLLVSMIGEASAHVFFTGGNADISSGVIMHVTPDDDPIAGTEAKLYFDLQNQAITTDVYLFRLYVTDSKGVTELAATYPAGKTSVSAKYAFPVQGVYELTLRATPVYIASEGNLRTIDFTYAQRVSRGRIASPLDVPRYAWAEFGFIAALASLVVLIIVILSRRKLILQYTKRR